jgi:hypothetical protein
MRKLLVVGALGLLALLALLLHETRAQVDAAPAPRSNPAAHEPAPAVQPVAQFAHVAAPAATGEGSDKVNVNSDDFFDRFVERQPKAVSRAAMTCYRGGLHRRTMDQWITISFVGHVKNGEVTYSDVRAKKSTLDDNELETCMLAAVAKVHWHDDSLPDVDSYGDETTLNPERGGKKYLHDSTDDDAPAAPADTPR